MTAATKALDTPRKDPNTLAWPVTASTKIYGGTLVAIASGYAVPAGDTSGHVFVGVATDTVDNSSGANAALDVKVQRTGLFQLAYSGTAPGIGDTVYAVDDNTVGVAATTTNDVKVGVAVTAGASSKVWVDINK